MAYVSLDDLKRYLGIAPDNTVDDELLADLLLAAQRFVESPAGADRKFECPSDTTRSFDCPIWGSRSAGRNPRMLWLQNLDLCQITQIVNGDGTEVTPDQYVTDPRNEAPYHAITLKIGSGITWTYDDSPEGSIEVTGRWAYSVIPPADIIQAVKRLASWYYRQRDDQGTYGDRVIRTGDGMTILPTAIPRDVRDILASYQRVV